MFEKKIDFPCSVSDNSQRGENVAFNWIKQHRQHNQRINIWIQRRDLLTNGGNPFINKIAKIPSVQLVTKRNDYFIQDSPLLAFYPYIYELADICHYNISALAVVTWDQPFDTWTREVNAKILVPPSFTDKVREQKGLTVDPILTESVITELKAITALINQSNALSAIYEKATTVPRLQKLHDSGIQLPPHRMMEWAAAHGWRGSNVEELGKFATDINNGKKLRYHHF